MTVSVSWLAQHEPGLETLPSSTASGLHLAGARAAWDTAVVLALLASSASMGDPALCFSGSLNGRGKGIRN